MKELIELRNRMTSRKIYFETRDANIAAAFGHVISQINAALHTCMEEAKPVIADKLAAIMIPG